MITGELVRPVHDLICDEQTVWLQGSKPDGNTVPNFTPDWEENRNRLLAEFQQFTTATTLVTMRSFDGGFKDLDVVGYAAVHHTDGFITANPNYILHANPADCGEIAVNGISDKTGKTVLGLFHASRRIVNDGGHLRALEYLCNTHDVLPENLSARVSPSARAQSYKFADIDDAQKTSDRWADYTYQDTQGFWHVDFHGRSVADLELLGIKPNNMTISPVDTVSNPNYFSYLGYINSGKQEVNGGNGLFFAQR